ncbi:hypothetical protein KUTeg_014288 [Tegillarca granosa]|uniref:BHLH domain-containing protein n=1 Tax=Tegillarca granosa TaxID=220873 RepID=A0ABQ9EW58_TEGGR|nr:hypothetical protein KUTeg_014288 [Tegillarca granosa]
MIFDYLISIYLTVYLFCCYRLRSMKIDKNYKDKLEEENEDDDVRRSIKKMPNGKKLSRGEMSRVSAKVRRDKEAIEFTSLTNLLPFSKETIEKLDKNSIIRLIISYMRMKHHTRRGKWDSN